MFLLLSPYNIFLSYITYASSRNLRQQDKIKLYRTTIFYCACIVCLNFATCNNIASCYSANEIIFSTTNNPKKLV